MRPRSLKSNPHDPLLPSEPVHLLLSVATQIVVLCFDDPTNRTAFCMITDSSYVKPKSFYTNSYLQICSTSTKVELIPSVIFVYVLRSLLEALERAKSNIQRSTLPALRDCVTPEALTQMALLPQESQRVQRPRGPQSTGLLKASPVASVVFLFLRCCLGN